MTEQVYNTLVSIYTDMCKYISLIEDNDLNVDTRSYFFIKDIVASIEDTKIVKQKDIKEYQDNQKPHIVISCDASVKKNPGGPASVGYVIESPNRKQYEMAKLVPSTTNNQAEYDAIYEALVSFVNLNNHPKFPIEIRSDSKIVISQLKKTLECRDTILEKKRDAIWELEKKIPVKIKYIWLPRNSTQALNRANNIAQNLINVPNH